MNNKYITTFPGNTPLKKVPGDYFPNGSKKWFTLPGGIDKGKKMYFYDIGDKKAGNTIVFVHGNPETSYSYRKVLKSILREKSNTYRIIAMDHIGFGLSDQSSHLMVCQHHAENLAQLIEYIDPQNVTLVIHDWGGPIGIGAFLKGPGRVKNLVILNSTVFPIPQEGSNYKNYPIPGPFAWSRFAYYMPNWLWGAHSAISTLGDPAPVIPLMYSYTTKLIASAFGGVPFKEADAFNVYKNQFKAKNNAKSSKRLVKQSAIWGYGNTYKDKTREVVDTAPFYKNIQNTIGLIWGPAGQNIGVCAVLGEWDPLAKPAVLEQWTTNLPQLKGNIQIFKDTSHFIEEFKPDEIAHAIHKINRVI